VWSIAPDRSDPSAKPDYLELKTTAEINSDRDIPKFESKLRKMWAQSYLLGVQRIIIGFRGSNMDGTLLRVKEYHTREIPGMVVDQARRRGQREPAWDSNCCINFLGDFLQCKFCLKDFHVMTSVFCLLGGVITSRRSVSGGGRRVLEKILIQNAIRVLSSAGSSPSYSLVSLGYPEEWGIKI